jgi:hypothetical protein
MRRVLILALGTALTASLALASPAAPGKAVAAKAAAAAPAVDPTIPPPGWVAPKNAMGQPDLSGYWSNATMTPLMRNSKLTEKLVIPKAQAASLEKVFADALAAADAPTDQKKGPGAVTDPNSPEAQLVKLRPDFAAAGGDVGGYNTFWIDPGKSLANLNGQFRTSWIVEPASGQMPLSDNGKKLLGQYRTERANNLFAGPEFLPVSERCLIGFTGAGGPGMLNTIYNNNYQIVETPDAIVIDVEMVHDARVIPLFKDKTAALAHHRPASMAPWLGDSVGWWEGDTLVIDTVNVNPEQGRTGPIFLSDKGRVTERLTRTSATQIFYQFQVDDPVYYTQSWKAEEALNARKERVFEYACHEGNYAMAGILGGARSQEAQGIKPTMGPGIFGTPIPTKAKPGE